MERLIYRVVDGVTFVMDAVSTVDGMTKDIPVYGRLRGAILDTILGPAEDWPSITERPSDYN
jgi:hypothetical protein